MIPTSERHKQEMATYPFVPICDAPDCKAMGCWGFGSFYSRGIRGRCYCSAHRHLGEVESALRSPQSPITRPEDTASGQGRLLK